MNERHFIQGAGGENGADNGRQDAYDNQGGEAVEVTVEPTEVTLGRGEKSTIICRVKGARDYKVTWGKYAHDTSLPDYIRVRMKMISLNRRFLFRFL